ncbi:hypothetical protein Pth03_77420 [Planotetraspora thailandica]|uniref:Uncharacterized protein n=1 Tax=Planotetraspora thailandica TaxID=487172 RepID=A0A8J4DEW0_9ACTN|nr:hypothetical protein Pth03_77420 [Planotetraspora thailandica]
MIENLHENEWLSLRVIRDPDARVNGYVYSHESRCQGRIVAVLPYQDTPEGRRYLLKSEVTPCWGLNQILCAITGGYEGGDIADDAVRGCSKKPVTRSPGTSSSRSASPTPASHPTRSTRSTASTPDWPHTRRGDRRRNATGERKPGGLAGER